MEVKVPITIPLERNRTKRTDEEEGDQVGDGADFQAVGFGEAEQFREARDPGAALEFARADGDSLPTAAQPTSEDRALARSPLFPSARCGASLRLS